MMVVIYEAADAFSEYIHFLIFVMVMSCHFAYN